ncbi:MAG: uracil-xanthine permease [Clostridia bacterium]|nr:uracil-xanthine permease [Clostridia bacterium]
MNKNGLIYDVHEKPPFSKNLLFAFQQVLAILAATVLVPILVDGGTGRMSQAAALIGAGVGTLVYLLFTKFKSPVFLGSSFAFISPLITGVTYGYCGIILGSIFAGLVYVIIALIIKKVGAGWINKLMPPVIIGPTVALIGLSLAGSAMNNVMGISGDPLKNVTSQITMGGAWIVGTNTGYNLIGIIIGVITFLVTVIVSVKGSNGLKMIPFIIGVLAGYVVAALVTVIGYHVFDSAYCKIIDFAAFEKIADFNNWLPNVTFVGAIKELTSGELLLDGAGVISILLAFAPVALVVFAEHVADHKNLGSIIGKDLLAEPGLDRTLLGDGVGSMAGAFFGGCPNTTYGEAVGCVAISKNASVSTIFITACMCIVLAFIYPVMLFIQSIPGCVVGGICIALYGFIAVSGLKMFKDIDLNDSKNLFVVAAILIPGIGGLTLNFGSLGVNTFATPLIQISSIACALVLGIVTNFILKPSKKKAEEVKEDKVA